MEARQSTELRVWLCKLLVELGEDLSEAGLTVVTTVDFDPVLIDVVAEHHRKIAPPCLVNIEHCPADAMLTGVARARVTKDQNRQRLSIAKIGDLEWPLLRHPTSSCRDEDEHDRDRHGGYRPPPHTHHCTHRGGSSSSKRRSVFPACFRTQERCERCYHRCQVPSTLTMCGRRGPLQMARVFLRLVALCALWPQGAQLSAQALNESLTVVSSDGRQTIRTIRTRQRDMVALDDLAEIFGLEIDDSGDRTANVTSGGQVIIITADQQLVSVAGRLVSLRAAPRRADGQWLVPLDFLMRALDPVLDTSLELRQRSRLVLIGDVVVPRVNGRYRPRGGGAELALEVTPSAPYTVDREDGRLVVRFEADALDLDRLPAPGGELVIGIAPDPSSAGLLIDLGPAFEAFSVSSRPIRDDGVELVIELSAGARTTESVPTPTPTPPEIGSSAGGDPLPDLTAPPTVRVVAVDAGHGGSDDGTRGASGTLEKEITLSIARRLRDQIEGRLGLRVILTRNRDDDVPLDARAAVANNNKADLFISLHVNASIRRSANGAEVSYLSMEEYGDEARALAGREAQLVLVIGGGVRQIDLVQWEMAQVQYLNRSARLADIVHEELSRRVPMSTRGVQEAPFRVLVGANMPAVLIEMGFISNQGDEQRLRSAQFQNAVVDALTDSVLRFRSYIETLGAPLSDTAKTDQPGDAQMRNE